MAHSNLKKNLEKLMQDQNWDVYELERKAGLKKNNIYHIIKGQSKRPSADILQSIADVLGVSIKDLFSPNIAEKKYLGNKNLDLMADTAKTVIEEIKKAKIEVTADDVLNILKESFDYSLSSNLIEADRRFIQWIIKQKYQNKILL